LLILAKIKTLKFLNLKTRKVVKELIMSPEIEYERIETLHMNGNILIVGRLGKIEVWDIKNGKLIQVIKENTFGHPLVLNNKSTISTHKSKINGLKYKNNFDTTTIIFIANSSAHFYDLNRKKILKSIKIQDFSDPIYSLAVNGNKIFASGKIVKIWDIKNARLASNPKAKQLTEPDLLEYAIAVDKKNIYFSSEYATIKVWDRKNKRVSKVLQGHQRVVTSLYVTDKFLISGSWDKTIKIWNKDTGELIMTLKGHERTILALTVKNDILIAGSSDQDYQICGHIHKWEHFQ